MVSLVYLPMSSPVLMQWMPALVVGGVALSALLSGWLTARPRIQKFVTALAMATILALSVYHAAHPTAFPLMLQPVIDCDAWWNWLTCQLL